MVELLPCSKGECEAAIIAHQPASQGIEPGTTESVDQEEPLSHQLPYQQVVKKK